MADRPWDVIIVGQGLAGTALAWCLQDAGKQVLILDASEPATSSKIAAGLMTPITGQRLHISHRYDEFMRTARAFYTSVEKRTGRSFFYERTALRLFRSEGERQKWSERRRKPEYVAHLLNPQPEPLIDPGLCDAEAGGFAMRAAQLDVATYLAASRDVLACEPMDVDWQRDVEFGADGVRVGDHRAGLLISCEGYRAERNPHFSNVRFKAAKGDILTVRFRRPLPAVNLHREIWLAPTSEAEVFKAGATYDWGNLDPVPDPTARRWIEQRLRAFVRVPYAVKRHSAAVRPVLQADRVLIGLHPERKQLGYFNGLGSKGSLQAPWYAQRLTRRLVDGFPLPRDVDVGTSYGSR